MRFFWRKVSSYLSLVRRLAAPQALWSVERSSKRRQGAALQRRFAPTKPSFLAHWLRRIALRHSVLLDLTGLDFGRALLRGAGAGGKPSLEQKVHRPVDGNSHDSRFLVHPTVTVQRGVLRRPIACEILHGSDLQARRGRQRPNILKGRSRRAERLAHLEITQYAFTREKSHNDEDDQRRAELDQDANA